MAREAMNYDFHYNFWVKDEIVSEQHGNALSEESKYFVFDIETLFIIKKRDGTENEIITMKKGHRMIW